MSASTGHTGRARRGATNVVPATGSAVALATGGSDLGRRGRHRRQGNHAHGVVGHPHPLEGDAVHRAVVLADAAVGAAVVADHDPAALAPELLAHDRLTALHEAPARGAALLA